MFALENPGWPVSAQSITLHHHPDCMSAFEYISAVHNIATSVNIAAPRQATFRQRFAIRLF